MAEVGDMGLWLQLGVAGATLLILFVTIGYLFRFMGNFSENTKKGEDSKIEKLCDKIDNLVNVIADDRKVQAETRISNDKDQKIIVLFNTRELDKLAALITYGNGLIPGSTILKTAFNRQ